MPEWHGGRFAGLVMGTPGVKSPFLSTPGTATDIISLTHISQSVVVKIIWGWGREIRCTVLSSLEEGWAINMINEKKYTCKYSTVLMDAGHAAKQNLSLQ